MPQYADAESHHSGPQKDPALADLISRLFHDAEALLLQELALARAEIGETLGQLVAGLALLLAAVAIGFTGALALVAAIILLLGNVMPLWSAFAIVGVTVLATGATVALFGHRLTARSARLPSRTLQSLRDTGAWAREELT
jgi:hypothetical protein